MTAPRPLSQTLARLTFCAALVFAVVMACLPQPPSVPSDAPDQTAVQLFWRGVLANAINPKVMLFFLAFLPQFADPAQGGMARQIMLLGLVFMLATLLVFGAIACFSGGCGALLQRSARAQTVLNRVAGLVFLGLAVRLATAER